MNTLHCIAVTLVLPLVLVVAQPLKTVYVTIRVDDVFMRESPLKPQEVGGFIDVCEKHGGRVMLATIPHRLLETQNQDGEMASTLIALVGRGHMVSMHGYDHQCKLCGSTGHEFECTTRKMLIPFDQQMSEMREGKELLEKITGKPITTYVSPGSDDQLNTQTLDILKKLGFIWVTDSSVRVPTYSPEISRVPEMDEFTWDLSDSSYQSALAGAEAAFVSSVERGNYFGLAFHDHFTRRAFRNGIVLSWADEMLSFIDKYPGVTVRYITIDDIDPAWFAIPRSTNQAR